jgi:hypothetical protein
VKTAKVKKKEGMEGGKRMEGGRTKEGGGKREGREKDREVESKYLFASNWRYFWR